MSRVVAFGGECTAEETDSLVAKAREAGAKTIVGCGGGKVLDTARAAADLLEVPVVNAPTAASTDSPCTALSVLYTATGDFDSYRFYKSHPRLVLVDTAVVARAPKRLLVSGMGDALGTWFEARTTYEAFGVNLLSGACTQAGLALARCCYETLIRDGEEALAAVDEKVVTPALERVIEANTLLSGLGAESGGLAVAHALHNGMTQAPGSHKFLHGENAGFFSGAAWGEKVAFGTVTQLVLEGRPRQELDEVFSFCCKVGLPVTLAQVGLDAADAATLLAVARAACAEGETCHNEPFKMVPEALRDAMLAADKLGRRYLDRVPPLT
eukprot:scaffold2.g7328.t1